MNSLIDFINVWGSTLGRAGWALFWQSSLLILILWVVDALFRRRLRPAVRYALWLLVLVRLVLPPSLAIKPSLAWWLRSRPEIEARPAAGRETVVILEAEHRQRAKPESVVSKARGQSSLSMGGGLLLGWSAVSLGLLGWMLKRGAAIQSMIRDSSLAPDTLQSLLQSAKDRLGIRQRVELRLAREPAAPALCGLRRPVILLPRILTNKLDDSQLRAVLLHELMHLRRGDVMINCIQALLQIVYWWHPLFWLANAQVRRLREEAVDDAVMMALAQEEEVYAPALLSVAKLSMRPLPLSPGLVGILESRGVLRQRIERLLEWRRPKKAGLGMISAMAVCLFGIGVVPMGSAPPVVREKLAASKITPEPEQKSAVRPVPAVKPGPTVEIEARFIEVTPAHAPEDDPLRQFRVSLEASRTNAVPQPLPEVQKLRGHFAEPENLRLTVGTNPTVVQLLTRERLTEFSEALAKARGVELLASPRLVMSSGQQGAVSIEQVLPIVVGTKQHSEKSPANDAGYQMRMIRTGKMMDVTVEVESGAAADPNGAKLRMHAVASVVDFLGYEDPKNPERYEQSPQAPRPVAKFRMRSMTAAESIMSGEGLLLSGAAFEDQVHFKSKVPVLGDVPGLGRLFRSESKSMVKRELLILVTAKVVSAGPESAKP